MPRQQFDHRMGSLSMLPGTSNKNIFNWVTSLPCGILESDDKLPIAIILRYSADASLKGRRQKCINSAADSASYHRLSPCSTERARAEKEKQHRNEQIKLFHKQWAQCQVSIKLKGQLHAISAAPYTSVTHCAEQQSRRPVASKKRRRKCYFAVNGIVNYNYHSTGFEDCCSRFDNLSHEDNFHSTPSPDFYQPSALVAEIESSQNCFDYRSVTTRFMLMFTFLGKNVYFFKRRWIIAATLTPKARSV